MALFVLGDTHLSLGGAKPMDVFPGWSGYVEKLEASWRRLVKPEDTGGAGGGHQLVDAAGRHPEGLRLPEQPARPQAHHEGQPRLLWSTANKMNEFSGREGFDTLRLLHNNSYTVEGTPCAGPGGGSSTRTSPTTKR